LGPKACGFTPFRPARWQRTHLPEFDELLAKAQGEAPTRSLVTVDDVGNAVASLALDGAKLMTGDTWQMFARSQAG